MAGRVTIRLDQAAIRRLTSGPGGTVDQAVRKASGRARDLARRNLTADGLVDTGRLRQSVRFEHLRTTPSQTRYEVGSDLDYAIYPERGTRAHGPRTARVLRFKPKGSGTIVFAKRVRGVRAYRWLSRVLDQLRASDFV